MNHDTETIDKLFLELSQFTIATTARRILERRRTRNGDRSRGTGAG